MISYSLFLLLSGIVFTLAERFWPRQRQAVARQGYWLDVLYAVFNAEIAGALVAIWIGGLYARTGWTAWRHVDALTAFAQTPEWVQILVLLLVKDLIQWGVHFTLHHVPALWEFHKIHHSAEVMDWLSNWRFHWLEIVVYQTVLYLPANLLGLTPEVTFGCAVISTTLGHFAHANLRWRVGALKYVINSPEMHVWHHVHPEAGPVNRNFAISIAIWDWIFGTAHVPADPPLRLGISEPRRA